MGDDHCIGIGGCIHPDWCRKQGECDVAKDQRESQHDLTPEALDKIRSEVMTLEWDGSVWVLAEDYAALSAALERAERERDVLVAAAYEAAAKACERAAYGGEFAQDDNVELGCLRSRDYIRALTPDDAREALERVRREERERCAKVAIADGEKTRATPNYDEGASGYLQGQEVAAERIAAAIRGDDT